MSYCKINKSWYWTIDEEVWHSENEFIVREGDLKGKRIQDEDMGLLKKLVKLDHEVIIGHFKEDCALCKN